MENQNPNKRSSTDIGSRLETRASILAHSFDGHIAREGDTRICSRSANGIRHN